MAEEAKQTCASGIAGEISKYSFKTCEDEANFVIDAVQKKLRAGARGGDIAVLVRTNTQIERFRSKCDEFGIEYFIRENADSDEMAFYKQDEVKAAMAFLQTVTNPKDVQSFVQAAAAIKVLPPTCLSKLEAQLGKLGGASTIVAFCRKFLANPKSVRGFSLPPKSRERLTPFVKNVSQCIDQIPLDNAQAALKRVVEGVGYYSHLTKTYPKTHEEKRRVLDELYGKAEGKSVASFLKPEGDRLHIITLHCAKGLEFDTVFMVGMEEGTFPHFNAIQGESIEEEMRLCYVGITRSKKELYFTHAAWRYKSAIEDFEEMRPSQFLKKIFEAEP